jgi:hypothetical protein
MDYKESYTALSEKLEKEVPVTAYPIRELVQILRDKGNPITLKSKLIITKVFNTGDISGIVCTIGEDRENVFICSLSHLKFDPTFHLYNDIVEYQLKRSKRISQLNKR